MKIVTATKSSASVAKSQQLFGCTVFKPHCLATNDRSLFPWGRLTLSGLSGAAAVSIEWQSAELGAMNLRAKRIDNIQLCHVGLIGGWREEGTAPV